MDRRRSKVCKEKAQCRREMKRGKGEGGLGRLSYQSWHSSAVPTEVV